VDLPGGNVAHKTRLILLGIVFSLFPYSTTLFAQSVSNSISLGGKWEGALGIGATKLRVVVTISKTGAGEYAGSLDSVDQGGTLPLDNIRLDGDTVFFELKALGGVYKGTLSGDGAEITGTWTQTAAPSQQSLSFIRQASGSASRTTDPSDPAVRPETVALDITTPIAPTAFKADGKWHLAYELHVSNLGKWDCHLTGIEVITEGTSSKLLAQFMAADLLEMVVHPGQPDAAETLRLTPGSMAIVYMWVTMDSFEQVPVSLSHRIRARVGTYPEDITIQISAIPIDRRPVVVISPPLTGQDWLAANGPSNTSAHRRALISLDGRGQISQRFAIDWVELNPDGKTFQNDPSDNKNYRAYGSEIHAVADGVVTEVKDGIPQNTPGGESLAVPITLETVGGNHVIMKIGDGLYAFYAHMQPGSLRVKLGDHVRRGQVLGLVGNTGNSSEPHLHFDICNASSMLACEGLPYAFASFEAQGNVNGQGRDGRLSVSEFAPAKHEMEIPVENQIIGFSLLP
jgi:murein DD-endopeptidase